MGIFYNNRRKCTKKHSVNCHNSKHHCERPCEPAADCSHKEEKHEEIPVTNIDILMICFVIFLYCITPDSLTIDKIL